MKKIILCVCLLTVLLAGCKKQDSDASSIDADAQIPIPEEEIVELPKWIPGDYPRIGIFFGYGYQTEEEQAPVLAELAEEYEEPIETVRNSSGYKKVSFGGYAEFAEF